MSPCFIKKHKKEGRQLIFLSVEANEYFLTGSNSAIFYFASFSIRVDQLLKEKIFSPRNKIPITLLHSERPKLYIILAFLSANRVKYGRISSPS